MNLRRRIAQNSSSNAAMSTRKSEISPTRSGTSRSDATSGGHLRRSKSERSIGGSTIDQPRGNDLQKKQQLEQAKAELEQATKEEADYTSQIEEIKGKIDKAIKESETLQATRDDLRRLKERRRLSEQQPPRSRHTSFSSHTPRNIPTPFQHPPPQSFYERPRTPHGRLPPPAPNRYDASRHNPQERY
jgi:uncharacterized protein (DUF1800 family)